MGETGRTIDDVPAVVDPQTSMVAMAEIEAIVACELFGLSRDELGFILETFPIVKCNDIVAYGECRTKRMILEIYDAMAEAARTGVPYQTRLDPPPADPRVAHAARA